MNELKIEKNVPIPLPKNKSLSNRRIFLQKLEIGDSFLIKDEENPTSYRTLAMYIGIKLLQRKTSDGIRIWRIK